MALGAYMREILQDVVDGAVGRTVEKWLGGIVGKRLK
jgi:hypothetical protein